MRRQASVLYQISMAAPLEELCSSHASSCVIFHVPVSEAARARREERKQSGEKAEAPAHPDQAAEVGEVARPDLAAVRREGPAGKDVEVGVEARARNEAVVTLQLPVRALDELDVDAVARRARVARRLALQDVLQHLALRDDLRGSAAAHRSLAVLSLPFVGARSLEGLKGWRRRRRTEGVSISTTA
jgi:hypothetical protein